MTKPLPMSPPYTQILISNDHSPLKGTRDPWVKKSITSGLEHKIYKMSLKHLVIQDHYKTLKDH